jgi:hypothetical protein
VDAFLAVGDYELSIGPNRVWLNTTVTSVSDDECIPENFKLLQNFPNPFNPTTVIGYQLSNDNIIKLKIYNTLGREVKTLVDSFQSAGENSVVWNGTDNSNNPVCSGVYFYSLISDASIVQKKMILMR